MMYNLKEKKKGNSVVSLPLGDSVKLVLIPNFFFLFRAILVAYGGSKLAAESERQLPAYRNAGSKPHLQSIPQLMATPDP